jgi:hypothetical protein
VLPRSLPVGTSLSGGRDLPRSAPLSTRLSLEPEPCNRRDLRLSTSVVGSSASLSSYEFSRADTCAATRRVPITDRSMLHMVTANGSRLCPSDTWAAVSHHRANASGSEVMGAPENLWIDLGSGSSERGAHGGMARLFGVAPCRQDLPHRWASAPTGVRVHSS